MNLEKMHKDLDSLYQPRPNSPAKSLRASDIGFPCDLYHVRNFLDWQQKKQPDAHLCRIFEMGRLIEKLWIAKAREAGYRIFDEQKSVEWRKFNMSGSIDGYIELAQACKVLFDVKSMHPNIWQKYDESNPDAWRELLKNPYFIRAVAQGQAYMIMEAREMFLFVLVNKSNLEEKFLFMPLDWELQEEIALRADRVNGYLKTEMRPKPIEYDETLCGRLCPYRHICLPDRTFEGAEFVEDDDIKDAVRTYFDLKEAARDYETAHGYLKAQLGKFTHGFIDDGNYEFEIKDRFYKAQPEKMVLAKPERIIKELVLIDRRNNTNQKSPEADSRKEVHPHRLNTENNDIEKTD